MKKRLKRILEALDHRLKVSPAYSKLIFVLSLFVTKPPSDLSFHFLLPHPGNGNVGDQAMVESFLKNVGSDCVLVVENEDQFRSMNRISPEPRFVEVPNLIYGNIFQTAAALTSIIKMSKAMKSFSVIGADVMDGGYAIGESINRLFLLRVINSLGIQTRITGFSWSAKASPLAISLLRQISTQTKLCVRDPNSVRRLERHKVSNLTRVADLVFSDASLEDVSALEVWIASSDKPIVIVNISGLGVNEVSACRDHVNQYSLIVEFLHLEGFRVLILPHVFRVGDGDLDVSSDLFKTSCTSVDLLISERLSPAQERKLLGHTSFAITGRMHVAILALSVGKPVIALETMGKVQGLFELFDLSEYCLDRNADFGDETIRKIARIQLEYSSICQKIEKKIPEVKQLSRVNFSELLDQ